MTQLFDHGYALLVGVGRCAESQLSLPVTVKDVQALRQILANPNFCAYPDHSQHLRLLHDEAATRQAILSGLDWLNVQAQADPEATLIVYYSGHGWLESTTGSYYLIPHDFDAYDWRNTALSAQALSQALGSITAGRMLVVLDTCHAAGIPHTPEPRLPQGVVATAAPQRLIEVLTQNQGRVVFTSCQRQQKSWIRPDSRLSFYAHHLIEALQGAASRPGPTAVTPLDLANHLSTAVPASVAAMGAQQNPQFAGVETEQFAIALLRGGRGLPAAGWEPTQEHSPRHNQPQVTASGNRSIAIGGHITGSTLITGDNNVTGSGNLISQGEPSFNVATAANHSPRQSSPASSVPLGQIASQPEPHPSQLPNRASEKLETDQQEVFISYAWGGQSEDIATQIDEIFRAQGISLIRDKNDLGFKGRIKAFMERIGRGKCVVVIISEKYLKSENCMFELLQIAQNEDFYGRIFPIVLEDAKIYKPKDRIRYVQYWEQEIQELDQQIRSVSSANLEGFREDIDLYNEIRRYLPRLTHILKNMNTLTAKIHSESGFEVLIKAIQKKLDE